MNLLNYWNNSISLSKYFELHAYQAKNNETSGENQSEDLIRYTKLNNSRSKRSLKQITLPTIPEEVLKLDKEINLLIITETWCGDSAQVLPVFAKLEEAIPNLKAKVTWRDANPELIDAYLTNGGRSIPKIVAFDSEGKELFTWGPRPAKAQELVMAYKHKAEPKESYDEFSIQLQNWYNTNGGNDIAKEIYSLLQTIYAF